MKKIIKLTERDLTRIVKRVINENNRLKNEKYINDILDKINTSGIESISPFEKRILDDQNVDVYQELLNKIKKEGGTKNLTQLEKEFLNDFQIDAPKDPFTQSFISDFVDGEGAKIVRQEDRTKLDEAYKFLNDYVENNLRPVEVVNKNPKLGEDYIDAVFFMDKNDNILIQFFREDPTIEYLKGYPKNALTFEMGFKSFICNPFDLHSVDFDEVVYEWGFNMFGEPEMSTGARIAKFMGRP